MKLIRGRASIYLKADDKSRKLLTDAGTTILNKGEAMIITDSFRMGERRFRLSPDEMLRFFKMIPMDSVVPKEIKTPDAPVYSGLLSSLNETCKNFVIRIPVRGVHYLLPDHIYDPKRYTPESMIERLCCFAEFRDCTQGLRKLLEIILALDRGSQRGLVLNIMINEPELYEIITERLFSLPMMAFMRSPEVFSFLNSLDNSDLAVLVHTPIIDSIVKDNISSRRFKMVSEIGVKEKNAASCRPGVDNRLDKCSRLFRDYMQKNFSSLLSDRPEISKTKNIKLNRGCLKYVSSEPGLDDAIRFMGQSGKRFFFRILKKYRQMTFFSSPFILNACGAGPENRAVNIRECYSDLEPGHVAGFTPENLKKGFCLACVENNRLLEAGFTLQAPAERSQELTGLGNAVLPCSPCRI